MRLPAPDIGEQSFSSSKVAQWLDALFHFSLLGSGDHAASPFFGQLVQRLRRLW
jgi:hypothetical protein